MDNGARIEIEEALKGIEDQLEANLGYFSGSDRETLEILQGHIKDRVGEIRGALTKEHLGLLRDAQDDAPLPDPTWISG